MPDNEEPNRHSGSADDPRSGGQGGDLVRGDPEDAEKLSGRTGGGDSGGGAYPNPHSGTDPGNGGFMGHGGQTEMPYHGKGQLGEEAVEENENAPARKTGEKDD